MEGFSTCCAVCAVAEEVVDCSVVEGSGTGMVEEVDEVVSEDCMFVWVCVVRGLVDV